MREPHRYRNRQAGDEASDAGRASGLGSALSPKPARDSRATLTRLFRFQFLLSAHVVA
jgi:hypothetical protein